MVDVMLHVGLPKTGTSTIQLALQQNREALRDAGVLFPAGSVRGQRLAAFDLVGQRVNGQHAPVAGAWHRLVEEIDSHDGHSAVVSQEELGLARPRQVGRLLRAMPDHQVFVIVTVRDLARTLVSAWQQAVVMGSTLTWREFAAAVRDPDRGGLRVGTGFWARQDLARLLDVWSAHVPVDRVRVVTVPPRGCAPHVLLERFAAAAHLPAQLLVDAGETRNRALGAAEVEVIRRLNERVVGPLDDELHHQVVTGGIKKGWDMTGSRSLVLPDEDFAWVLERSRSMIALVENRGHDVYGDLADLVPRTPASASERLDVVSPTEMLDATQSALAALAVAHGRLLRRLRRNDDAQASPTDATHGFGSWSRAHALRARKLLLTKADDSRVLAWAARAYLRRTSAVAVPGRARRSRGEDGGRPGPGSA